MTEAQIPRTVYIVSDSTGITAETFSQSVLAQFDNVKFRSIRVPYVDTLEKAEDVSCRIDRTALETGLRPIVFSTLVNRRRSRRACARPTASSSTCSAPSSATSSRPWA